MSDASGSVVFLSGDLLFASRVRGAAESAGLPFVLSGRLPDDDGPIAWVIVDLATRSGILDGLMDQIAARCPDAKVLAYGPHVQTERINAAREAGVPTVITRGQFDRALPELFGD